MEDKGGTMRLGLYPAKLTPGSKAAAVYGQEVIYERHRHRFEVNNRYRQTLEAAGMILSGQSPDGRLVEIVELERPPVVRGQPVPPGVQVAARSARTRCSTGSWRRRSPSATGASRSSARPRAVGCAGATPGVPTARPMSSSPSPAPDLAIAPSLGVGSSAVSARRSSVAPRSARAPWFADELGYP